MFRAPNGWMRYTCARTCCNELLQTPDHFDDRPQFMRSAIDHLECDVENHSQADISDPAMILQHASNEVRRDAHQRNRQCKTEYQNDRLLPRATCDSEEDRKSTRLNSSHLVTSYAASCLKRKTPATIYPSTRVSLAWAKTSTSLISKSTPFWYYSQQFVYEFVVGQ